MGLFDAVRAMGQAVFGSYFLPATLHRQTLDADGAPMRPPVFVDAPVSAQVDMIRAENRPAGVPGNAVRILVLQGGVSPAPTLDDEITAGGVRYRIMAPIATDPANVGWDLMGVQV